MSQTKQELRDLITPILEKGKPINDIIFTSQKMTAFDICFMLKLLRPTKKPFFDRGEDNTYGWSDEQINKMADNPVWGGDGIQQLIFGCIAALDVYTEDEIITVLNAQEAYSEAD